MWHKMTKKELDARVADLRREHSGRGSDRKGTRKDGLRFRWQWIRCGRLSKWSTHEGFPEKFLERRLPCQSCEAKTQRIVGIPGKGFFSLEAIAWSTDGGDGPKEYEARVEWVDNYITSKGGFKTRLEAQLEAEKLLFSFLWRSFTQLERVGINR